MTHLLYCIFRERTPALPESLSGVAGEQVFGVGHHGLVAAVSRWAPDSSPGPSLDHLRLYARVVARLHRDRTVIPLRFGCRLAGPAAIRGLFKERGPRFDALLSELEDCVEMGISILLPGPEKAPDPETSGAERAGRAYLKARQIHFARQEQWQQECGRLAEECRSYLSGHFVKFAGEGPFSRRPLVSLYFLVPRGSVENFRARARGLTTLEGGRLLLSGPWPPYNFVTEAHLPMALPEERLTRLS